MKGRNLTYLEEEELLRGAIDMHIHTSPHITETRIDAIQAAIQARDAGMKAIVIKDNFTTSAGTAYLVNRMVHGIDVFGAIVLNQSVGGLNLEAVRTAIKYGNGAKVIWMPTSSATNHINFFGIKKQGITICREGKLLPEVEEIIDIISENNLILATGHLSVFEQELLVKTAIEKGVKKIVITHPELEVINMPLSIQKKFAEMGAYLEYCFASCTPGITIPLKAYGGIRFNYVEPVKIANMIKEVGPEHCIMSTDLGGSLRASPLPVEGMKMFIYAMLELGISESEIDQMIKVNPYKLLYK